jgi:hypothetical protein
MKPENAHPESVVTENAKPESAPAAPGTPANPADIAKSDARTKPSGRFSQARSALAKTLPEKIAAGLAAIFAVAVILLLFHLTGEIRRLQEKNAVLESQIKILRENAENANLATETLRNKLAAFERQVSQNLDNQQARIRELQHARAPENPPPPIQPENSKSRESAAKHDDPRQNYVDFVETTVKKLFAAIRDLFAGIWEFLTGLASNSTWNPRQNEPPKDSSE